MPWLNNRQVTHLYASKDQKNVWARVSGDHWRQLSGAHDGGLVNLASMLSAAKTHGRTVFVFVGGNNKIERVRLT